MKYIKNSIFFFLSFICSVSFAGSEANIFVPNQYAPVSSYVLKDQPGAESLTFKVKPEIVKYVVDNGYHGYVARQDLTTKIVSLLEVTSADVNSGIITLTTSDLGKYVVVAEPFTNDFPIVTHWYQALNGGKGGQQLGASDAINTIDFSPEYNAPNWIQDINDTDPKSPYQWNTAKYALFGDPSIRVPSYERYIGENYSVNKITDLFAVSMSLKSVESNGYPILHRNYPWALYDKAPAEQQIHENIPAFQIVHDVLLEAETGKPSLSTYILPPLWNKNPSTFYPIMFNGHYDLNLSTAMGSGVDFIQVISNLQKDGLGSAIGILWNGGGAYGSQTIQQSSFLGAAYTMYAAQVLFGADPMKVVTTGISRGGATAITVAANPYFNNYKVQYALAYSPAVAYGEHVSKWFSTNYAQNFMSLAWATGYKYSYKNSFIDSLTGYNGRDLFLYNTAGSKDPSIADHVSPLSDLTINTLKSNGTNIMISTGTNDPAIPTELQLRLFNKLKTAGVPTEMHIGYRFGHTMFTDRNAQLYWAMKQVMTGANTPYSNNIKHYHRASETWEGYNTAVEFTPGNILSVNFPKLAWRGQKLRLEAFGSKGITYAIAYHKIDDAQWTNSNIVSISGLQNLVTIKTFNGADALQSQYFDYTFPITLVPGYYILFVASSVDQGANWDLVDPTQVPQFLTSNQKISVFQVQGQESSLPALDINFQNTPNDRGWGLSTY